MKSKTSLLVAAALAGLGSVATAGEVRFSEQFIPIEKLNPEYRALMVERIRALEQVVRIDWNQVAAGVNEKGELTLKDRIQALKDRVSNPSCWSETKNGNE